MPNILVKIPQGAFPGESRATLVRKINEAAAAVEQMPDEPRALFMCWVLVDEVMAGGWTCGGADATAQYLPCMARVLLPAGVLDDASRSLYAARMHAAFAEAMPANDRRRLMTSVVLDEVPDGAWGVSGEIWTLPDFARSAGYAHLQHLARSPA
ncbi:MULTISPECIES: tautomerase family protein [Variovorax]|jgi:phenylpyruvate tautomerase PptA (4-oxalocrotonate tautomerase family)|uniref:tautomerase family protein n=1 Tax=Variovorax TaxID=34072 RepID=UPI00086B760C|nr:MULTISPECIES: tautomerase [Variovorax]MBN8757930.1 tautomerase [Variovorax sp.]ODU13368.1 MAG: tautomerase [Variovorax sp. SCN 67-85]ODV23033.1 MAG: tautomerase [Variovorax sp. SCN 67-20]OJZ12954.1 MAG: tautomerase [Variovorax sp. 67-131]UKI09541.1 tautomerase [Variovorax paradoxus]